MAYIGNPIYQSAFVTDQFSGDGTTTAFTMSVSPAGVSNVLVAVSGVLQDPSTYGVVGTTINFSTAPPSGTGNISCRYLGVPVTGVTTTAYRTVTEFTATASQTTFTPPSYAVGFINVYRNGVLLGSADYTASNGTTVVLATGATAGDLITVESFQISSVANAIQNTAGSVGTNNIAGGAVTAAKMASASVVLTSSTVSGVLPQANGGTGTTVGYNGFKNRIINGDMTIDQRNNGASVTPSITSFPWPYSVDRWSTVQTQASKFSIQQNAGAVTPPPGFRNYLGITVGASANVTVGVNDIFQYLQRIEGFNTADLDWGTANASPVTLSFWVRSSIAGTFGGALGNVSDNYVYPYSYTINATNTWEYKTISITGATAGTWGTTNGIGINVTIGFGAGTNQQNTPGAWSTLSRFAPTGQTNLIATNGATFYITGVQLEKGSTATSFDVLPYSTELQLCMRYCQFNQSGAGKWDTGGVQFAGSVPVVVPMRTTPSVTIISSSSALDQLYVARRNFIDTPTFYDVITTSGGFTGGQAYVSTSAATGSAEGIFIANKWLLIAEL
jgi:hypothetical protein